MKQLMRQLAIPLSNQKTVAKWLVIAIRLGYQKTITKSLVMMKQLMKQLAIPLVKQLANPLGCPKTATKWLVISNQNTVAKWLVIAIRLGYQMALHSHSAKSPKYGDISRWLTITESLVMMKQLAIRPNYQMTTKSLVINRWGER